MLALTIRSFAKWTVQRAFADAEIAIGGRRPHDVRITSDAFYHRLVRNPAFQLGETYMAGLWECDAIDELVERLLASGVAGAHERGYAFYVRDAWARVRNRQSRARAPEVATAHYDLDPELYAAMLDDSLTYTCAVWQGAGDTLAAAQQRKLRLVCDKLGLRAGDTLLDIGCGFGGLAAFAARHYGARVVGITNSVQHAGIARARTAQLPVEILELDYRDLPALGRRFDRVASIEMIEAVGPKNFATYMDVVRRCLAPGGRFLMQSFISAESRHVCNEWFDRYIFPNGVSPSLAQLAAASPFAAPSIDDLTAHYPPTLLAWDRRLTAAWPTLARRYDDRFRRMWHFYLTCLAGVFRTRDLRLCQLLYV